MREHRIILIASLAVCPLLLTQASSLSPTEIASGLDWSKQPDPPAPTCDTWDWPDSMKVFTQNFEVKKLLICPPISELDRRSVKSDGFGGCGFQNVNPGQVKCPPVFEPPTGGEISGGRHWWKQVVKHKTFYVLDPFWLIGWCSDLPSTTTTLHMGPTHDFSECGRVDADGDGYSPEEGDCNDVDPDVNPSVILQCAGLTHGDKNCNGIDDVDEMQDVCGYCPLLLDLSGNGFRLTGTHEGVLFDLRAIGSPERIAWTRPGTDDAWLALDRNGNGVIDDGTELFTNYAPQAPSITPNGFAALALFDENGDGWIDEQDAVFTRLLVWTDVNHDGVSQPFELRSLQEAGIRRISLELQASGRRDRFGNEYRYRAKVISETPREAGPYVYDVFLAVAR